MGAGKHGSSEVTIEIDDAPGGSLVALTNHVLTIGGLKIENENQMSAAFGDSWDEHTPTGRKRVPEVMLTGFLDDTASTGPHAILKPAAGDSDPQGATRTLRVGFGNSLFFTVETRLKSYEVLPKNGQLTEYAAGLLPTGSAAWS